VGPMPGRTHGLGLISERLLEDKAFVVGPEMHGIIAYWARLTGEPIQTAGEKRIMYGFINFWGTLLGGLFCLGFGRLIDRQGSRRVLTIVTFGLGLVVLAMTRYSGMFWLFIAVLLTRGLGQSALSVASITLVGKWFKQRQSIAMGIYSALVGLFFAAAFSAAGLLKDVQDWRVLWTWIGWSLLLGLVPLFWLLVRDGPEQMGLELDGGPALPTTPGETDPAYLAADDFTLGEALGSSAFWVFAIASGLYGLISAAISLFQESILVDLGFGKEAMYIIQPQMFLVGLIANVLFGVLSRYWRLGGVMAVAMGLLAIALLALPFVKTWPQIIAYAVTMSIAGGGVTVVFFMAWGRLYGRAHLGRIQGIAQMLTVFGSAMGPLIMAVCKAQTNSYHMVFYTFAPVSLVLMLAAWFVPLPKRTGRLPGSNA